MGTEKAIGKPTYSGGCLSTLQMQGLAGGAMAEPEMRAAKKHIRNCLHCQGRLKSLRAGSAQAGAVR
ncbi:MAG: hypothetical protein ACM3NH_04620 [Candidatus Saccharibacteria bacterium]